MQDGNGHWCYRVLDCISLTTETKSPVRARGLPIRMIPAGGLLNEFLERIACRPPYGKLLPAGLSVLLKVYLVLYEWIGAIAQFSHIYTPVTVCIFIEVKVGIS